ncbi:hypothetical protein ES703_32412 [subsurface metagenome]
MLWRRYHLIEHAVNPVTHLVLIFEGLKMNVRCFIPNRLQQNKVKKLLDGVRFGKLLQLIQVDTLVSALEFRKETVVLNLAYQVIDALFFGLVVFSQGLFQGLAIGYLRRNLETHQRAQVVRRPEIVWIIEHNCQFIFLLVVFNRHNVIGLSHLCRHLGDYIGGDIYVI